MKANIAKALGLVISGVAIAALALYIGEADDAPGVTFAGFALMVGAMVLAVRTAVRKT